MHERIAAVLLVFLSTPSARRATKCLFFNRFVPTKFLSTPSARRATNGLTMQEYYSKISIHALREEGDGMGHVVIAAAE